MKRMWPLAVLLALWSAGCGPPVISARNIQKHNYVIVQTDTLYSLTMPQLYEMLADSDVLRYGGTLTADEVKAFLDSILCDTLAGIAAGEIDLGRYLDRYSLYKQRYHRVLIAAYFDEVVGKKVTVDSQEVIDFRSSHLDLFGVDEQVMLYQVLISPVGLQKGPDSLYYRSFTAEQLEREIAEYAWRIRRLLDFGEPFTQVARKYSHDIRTAPAGGKVGWTKRGVYLDPFDSVAFATEPGAISQPYRDKTGWHILYVKDYMAEGLATLNEEQYQTARSVLINQEAKKIALPLKDSLLQLSRLVFNEELLDTNVHLVERGTWAAIVNERDSIDFSEMTMLEESYRRHYDVSNTTLEMKRAMLHQLAERYVLVDAAYARGIDTLPEVAAKVAALRHKYSKQVVYQKRRDPAWTPPDSLIEKYFREHSEQFSVKQELSVQHIIVEDSVFGEFIRDQAMTGIDFIDLAKEYYPGEPSIRADLANLGDIGPEDVPEELYAAALRTPVGGISHPVKTQYGFHIVKVLRRTRPVDVDQVRNKIVPILKKEHVLQVFNSFRDDLYARFRVRFPAKIYPIHLRPLALRSK